MRKSLELYFTSFSDVINAIKSKNVKQFNEWKAAGLSLNLKGPDTLTPLLYLVSKSLSDDIQFFAQHCPEEVISQFQSGLPVAANQHQFDLFRKLLDHYETIKPHVSVAFSENDLLRCYQTGLQIVVKSLDYLKYSKDDIDCMATDSPPIEALEDNTELLDAFDVDEPVEIPSNEELEGLRVVVSEMDTILQWGFARQHQDLFDEYSNVFRLALNVNNFEIMRMTFFHLLSHYFNRNAKLMLQHFERMFISAASQGRYDIIDWLDKLKGAIQLNNVDRYQDILNRALMKAASINFCDVSVTINCQYNTIHKLIRRINNITPAVLANCLRLTIDNLSNTRNIHADYLQLTGCIEYIISVARSNKIFNALLLNYLQHLNDHDLTQEMELKLFLFAIEQSFCKDSFPEENTAIDLPNHRLSDPFASFLIKSLSEVEKRIRKTMSYSGFYFLTLNLSYKAGLSHETAYSLSQWLCYDCGLTRLDLSNNPLLGGGSWLSTSGLQLIFLSLVKNTSLRILNLSNTDLNDVDFATLVMLLETNTTLDEINLSGNKALTEKSESLLMSLLLTRNKKKMPLLRFDFSGTPLKDTFTLQFTKVSEEIFPKEALDGSLIDELKRNLRGVDLILMSKEIKNAPELAKEGELYLGEHGYYVTCYKGKIYSGYLQTGVYSNPDIDLTGLSKKLLDLHFKARVLQVTSKRGHTHLNDAQNNPRKRETYLRGLVLYSDKQKTENIELSNHQLTDTEGARFVEDLREYWTPAQLPAKSLAFAKTNAGISLDLSRNRLDFYTMKSLNSWFNENLCALKILDLSHNPLLGGGGKFSKSRIETLIASLHTNTTLRQLKLAHCGIDDYNLSFILKLLEVNGTLVLLDISGNDLISSETIPLLTTLAVTRDTKNMLAIRPIFAETCLEEAGQRDDEKPLIAFKNQLSVDLVGFKLESLGVRTVQDKNHPVEMPFKTFLKLGAKAVACLIPILAGATAFATGPGVAIATLLGLTGASNLADILHRAVHMFEPLFLTVEFGEGIHKLHMLYPKFEEFMRSLYLIPANRKEIKILADRWIGISSEMINNELPEKLLTVFTLQFEDCISKVYDSREAKILAKTLVYYLRSFTRDINAKFNWITFSDDFMRWLMSTPLTCYEILRLKNIDPSNPRADHPLGLIESQKNYTEPQWILATHLLVRSGLQCKNANGEVLKFERWIKNMRANKTQEPWIISQGKQCGYSMASAELLLRIQRMVETHRSSKERCELFDEEFGLPIATLKYLEAHGRLVAIPEPFISMKQWRDNTDKKLTVMQGNLSVHGEKLLTANDQIEGLRKDLKKALEVAEKAAKDVSVLQKIVGELRLQHHLPGRIEPLQAMPQVANPRAQAAQQEDPVNDNLLNQRIPTESEEDINENSLRVAPK